MLSGPEIARQVQLGNIVISDFDPARVGPNSYDLTLGGTLAVYEKAYPVHRWHAEGMRYDYYPKVEPLDPRVREPVTVLDIPAEGRIVYPGVLYLGWTVERTSCKGFVPWIEGRSSIGRLGLGVHITAGLGDDGVDLNWTLEITAVHPIVIYPGMKICQICFVRTDGESKFYDGKYQGSRGIVESRYYLDPLCPPR